MKPNSLYRPDLAKSIEVFGDIDEGLVSRIAPKILSFRSQNISPITIHINSNGGEIRCLRYIFDLIKEPSPDGHVPRLITVGIGHVGSAAAALLGLGDYSIAYPGAGIYFHGARLFDVPELTVETASKYANQLDESNRIMASNLAKVSCERLAFRYWTFTNEIEDPTNGAAQGQPAPASTMSIDSFATLLRRRLSPSGSKIISRALQRWKSLREISDDVKKGLRELNLQGIDFEAEILRRIITFEVERSKKAENKDWNPARILPDFFLLKEYDTGSHHQFYEKIVQRFGDAFFTAAEVERLRQDKETPDAEQTFISKISETLVPFCYFAASICLMLHQLENPLSAEDAYWLGEVDEIYGSDLPCIRIIEEQEDDPPSEEPASLGQPLSQGIAATPPV